MGSISPSSPLRIAVLECDTPLPDTKARYHGYGGVFEHLLRAGAKSLGYPSQEDLIVTKHQIEIDPTNYPNLDDIDAILITGSRHDSFADHPWILTLVAFAQKVLAQSRVRIIGVCFGHQIVARAMGVAVGRNADGWEAAVNDVRLTEIGKQVFGVDALRIHQMHRDVVYACPEGVERLGYSDVCAVQGLYVPKRVITVQGHPEFNEEIMREIIETRRQMGIFDEQAYGQHIGKVAKEHDGVVVSSAFLRFLLDK